MPRLLFFILVLFAVNVYSQQKDESLTRSLIVKTNVLSFVAGRPTFSIETHLSPSVSAELSFVQGRFNGMLFTDHYNYSGLLLRVKKYLSPVIKSAIIPYAGAYAGNLRRTIQTKGYVDPTGWFSISERDFSAQSLRGGVSAGTVFFVNNHFMVDGQTSIGYGRYLNVSRSDPDTRSLGYLDLQVWLSVGYRF